MIGAALTALLAGTSGCDGPSANENIGSSAAALTTPASAATPHAEGRAAGATVSSLMLAWDVAPGTHQQPSAQTFSLNLHNYEKQPADGEVVLQLYGLGTHRTQSLGHFNLASGETRSIPWAPSTSSLSPIGSILRVVPQIKYTRSGNTVTVPGNILFVGFTADLAKAFASVTDGNEVRSMSMASDAKARSASVSTQASSAPSDPARDLRASVQRRHGRVDGHDVDESGTQSTGGTQELVGDSVSEPGSASPLPLAPVAKGSAVMTANNAGATANGTGTGGTGVCFHGQYGPLITANACASWHSSGFRDIGVTGGPPLETYDPTHPPAAYANATFVVQNAVSWSGRLDDFGCTPSFQYCQGLAGSVSMTVSNASLVNSNPTTHSYTREYQITPARTFTLGLRVASMGVNRYRFNGDVSPSAAGDDYTLRAASIVSRMLAMPDSGIPRAQFGDLGITHVKTENGCSSYDQFNYGSYNGVLLYGEACGSADLVELGPGLNYDHASGTYSLANYHTTIDAFTVAHEMGHSVEFDTIAGPPGFGYANKGTSDLCNCSNVTSSNPIHCLQSSFPHNDAFIEGWAHFYATRVMNNIGTGNPRFTYYKDVLAITDPLQNGNYSQTTTAPPVPVNAGQPYSFTHSDTGETVNGWARNWCSTVGGVPQTGISTEYDWLTFLWSLNGVSAADRLVFSDLFGIFGSAAVQYHDAFNTQPPVSWSTFQDSAYAQFGSNPVDSRYLRFITNGNSNGVNL